MADDKPPDKTKRQSPFMLRFTPSERDELDEAAREASMPTGTWIRSIALKVARERKRKREPKT